MYIRNRKKGLWIKNLYFSLITVFIFLGILELCLQLTSFTLVVENQESSKIEPSDFKKFKILTLGESTTADIYGEGITGSWPRHLERSLQQAGIATKVYNPAAPGIYTGYMREELPDYLERFKPDLVIAMIGINDLSYLSYIPKTKAERYLNSIKIIAVYKWVRAALTDSLYIYTDLILSDDDYNTVKKLSREEVTLEEIISFEKNAQNPKMFLRGIIELCYFPEGEFCLDRDKDFDLANEVVEYFLEKYPRNRMLFDTAISYYNMSNQEPKCVAAGIRFIKDGNDMGPRNLNSMGYCLAYVADQKCPEDIEDCPMRRKFVKKMQAYVPRFNGDSLMLRENVNAMIQEIQAQKIPIIFMQYPTLELEDMKEKLGLENRDDLFFVENKESFEKALETMEYYDVFNDKFAGSWGHTTEYGHQLIGNNIFNFIMKNRSEFLK